MSILGGSVLLGGRQEILSQVPKEIKDKHPRLQLPLTSEETAEMMEQSLQVLNDERMKGSHVVFCDIVRLIVALHLCVAEAEYKKEKIIPQQESPEKTPGGLILL